MSYHIDLDIDLRRNEEKGLYVALEGTEASGKTTQVEKLKEYFESKGREVIMAREPRKEGLIGDLVHQILRGEKNFPPKALQYLFTTERVLNHEEVVEPALREGKVVISDRVFWSGIVYGILDRMEEDYDPKPADYLLIAHSILSFYHQFIIPDFTFYLKISLEVSLERLKNERKQMKEIYEYEDKIEKVIEGYNALFDRFKNEVHVIDGEKSIENVTAQMIEKIKGKT